MVLKNIIIEAIKTKKSKTMKTYIQGNNKLNIEFKNTFVFNFS